MKNISQKIILKESIIALIFYGDYLASIFILTLLHNACEQRRRRTNYRKVAKKVLVVISNP